MIFFMQECEEKLGYVFKNKEILRRCFTHSSYSHEHGGGKDNERLEFFGDSILGFITAEYLVNKFPNSDEGVLTEYKQQLVSRKPLASAIVRAGLDEYILYGEGERKNSPGNHEAAHENLFEAIVAGIYLDGGLEPTKKFVRDFLFSRTRLSSGSFGEKGRLSEADELPQDYKGKLQIYLQKRKLGGVVYKEKSVSGPPHDPTFTIDAVINGEVMGEGVGKSKSEASKLAAQKAYAALTGKGKAAGADRKPKRDKSDGKRAKSPEAARKNKSENKNKNKNRAGDVAAKKRKPAINGEKVKRRRGN